MGCGLGATARFLFFFTLRCLLDLLPPFAVKGVLAALGKYLPLGLLLVYHGKQPGKWALDFGLWVFCAVLTAHAEHLVHEEVPDLVLEVARGALPSG